MNKTILITGSTDGIGKLAAIKLAKDGHTILLHGRNSEKLTSVISEIKNISKNENIKGFVADFSDLDAVKKMAQEVIQEYSEIDVLINNAGVLKSSQSQNSKGMDMRYAVNYLAPFVLTHGLLPLLSKGTERRIINLSSAAQAPISYDVLTGNSISNTSSTYAQSKLALTMWSFWLAKEQKDISIIAVNPGSLLNTKMVKEGYGYHWSPADKGADILYNLAISEEYKGITGKYFDNDNEEFAPAHQDAYQTDKIEMLIKTTQNIINS